MHFREFEKWLKFELEFELPHPTEARDARLGAGSEALSCLWRSQLIADRPPPPACAPALAAAMQAECMMLFQSFDISGDYIHVNIKEVRQSLDEQFGVLYADS